MFFKSKKEKATWKASDAGFHFYLDDEDIGHSTTNIFNGRDLLIYYPEKNTLYLLKNYSASLDGKIREAEIVKESENILWSRNGDNFYIIQDGKNIATEITQILVGEDIFMYHKNSKTTFLLKSFHKAENFELQKAEVLSDSASIFWYGNNAGMSILMEGKNISTEIQWAQSANSIIAYYSPSNITFQMTDYYKNKDGKLRPGKILSNFETSFWAGNSKGFRIIEKGINITAEVVNIQVDNSLFIYHEKTNTTYMLQDFFKKRDDKIHPAKVLSKTIEAYWMAKDGKLKLIYHGKILSKGVTTQAMGNDLAVMSAEHGIMFQIVGYKQHQDGKLRPVGG